MSYLEERRKLIEAGRPLPEKKKYSIPKKSKKRIEKEKEQRESKGDSGLDKWFEERIKENEPVCAECGMRADWLLEPHEDPEKAEAYRLMWRASQAHILPKKKVHGFPSIATNRANHIILFPSWGGHLCGCHGFYDSNWYNASTMKIWPSVLKTMKEKLLPFISENERKNIPEEILKQIEKEPAK